MDKPGERDLENHRPDHKETSATTIDEIAAAAGATRVTLGSPALQAPRAIAS
jgi:hypothetical protein